MGFPAQESFSNENVREIKDPPAVFPLGMAAQLEIVQPTTRIPPSVQEKMSMFGYTAPRLMFSSGASPANVGGFVIPLFGRTDEAYCAHGGATVAGFTRVAVERRHMVLVDGSPEVGLGDAYIYGFESRAGAVVFGSYEEMASAVRSQFHEFDDLPFTQTSMASFLADKALWADAMTRCYALMDATVAGAGARFRENNPYRST
jgi:hypothetical protein